MCFPLSTTTCILQLPESGVTDEEVHAIAALLRGNSTIAELNLRGNEVRMLHNMSTAAEGSWGGDNHKERAVAM